MQRWRKRGTLQAQRVGGGKRAILGAHGEWVHALLAAEPDLTIAEVRHRPAAAGIMASRS